MANLSKAQQKELDALRKAGEVEVDNDSDQAGILDELVELGLAAVSTEGDDSTVFIPTEGGEDASASDGWDPNNAEVPDNQHTRFLNFEGYEDTGFRTSDREAAKAEGERLRAEENRAAVLNTLKAPVGHSAYGVWAKKPGTATNRGSGLGLGKLVKRANACASNKGVQDAVANLEKAVAAAESAK